MQLPRVYNSSDGDVQIIINADRKSVGNGTQRKRLELQSSF